MTARVVRAGEPPRRVVSGEEMDARQQADAIVTGARQRAEALIGQAREGAEALRREAEDRGLREAEGRAAALLAEAAATRDRILADADDQVARLAVAVAERVIGQALEQRPELVRPMVRSVLERARRARRLELRVHPDDVEHLRGLGDGPDRVVAVEADPAVRRGGCVLRTDVGEVDARLEVRLAAVERALRHGG